jgi:uncharacterized LabA/DUF88 family protein
MVSQPRQSRTSLFSQGSFESSLNFAEWTALGTSVGGSVLGLLLQQGMLAISSFYLSSLGLSFVNRHRTEQQLKRQLEQQASYVQQVKENQKQTATSSQVQGLQQQIEVTNSNTSQQLQSLQQGVNSLQDSPVHWEQVEQQLEKLQTSLEAYFSNTQKLIATPVAGRGRVAIFIDHGNLEHTAKDLGVKRIEYQALLDTLKQDAPLAGAWFYIGVDSRKKKQECFLKCLRNMGYQIVDKPVIYRPDGSCKGNLDVELALNLVAFADQYDTAVLVSGDGDFTSAVKQVQQQGKKVEVVSIRDHASNDLRKAADRFISLKTIKDQICRMAA